MRHLTLCAVLAAVAVPAHGQDARLASRLPDPARTQVEAILQSARGRGLPVEPLVDRALEGAAKGAPPALIVTAVTRLRDELLAASTAFGAAATPAELTAGASALRAGATPDDLAHLREARSGRPLTVAAAVLADLVAAGVPADTAVSAVLALAAAAGDAEYVAFRRNVQRDIELGASPAAALGVRLRNATDLATGPNTGSGTEGRRKQKP